MSWFPSGFPEALKMEGPAVHLTPERQQPGGVPQTCSQPSGPDFSQGEFLQWGPAVFPASSPTTLGGGFYQQTPPGQEKPTSWVPPTPPLGEKPSSFDTIASMGEKSTLCVSQLGDSATSSANVTKTFAVNNNSTLLEGELQKMRLSDDVPLNTSRRIAPSPSLQKLVIPQKPEDKVPSYKRQLYLSLFLEEYVKFTPSRQEAQEKAEADEKAAYDGSPSQDAYVSAALSTLKLLKGLAPSLVRGLSRAALYSRLRRGSYLLSEKELKENGYPFPHPTKPGAAILFTEEKEKPQGSHRTCSRCGSKFSVSYTGHSIRAEDICHYHWGRLRRTPVYTREGKRYTCCSSGPGPGGCSVAIHHVHEGREENLEGFVKTSVKHFLEDGHPGIYALDCEMSYTVQGLELTRVSVVDAEKRIVYDTFVKPDNEIIDYNTRFSGVTEEDLAFTSTTLRDVQAVLLDLFNADTILVGHSLECDLLALRMIHSKVVDTAVLYKHSQRLRYKQSLRNLSSIYLNQTIQKKEHDSVEDAMACMSLVIWEVRNSLAGDAYLSRRRGLP